MTKKAAAAKNKPVYKMNKDEFVDIDSSRKIRKIIKFNDKNFVQKGNKILTVVHLKMFHLYN